MAKKKSTPVASETFEDFCLRVKSEVGEASEEVLQSWYDDTVALLEAQAKVAELTK